MNRKQSLFKNSVMIILGKLSTQFLSLLLLPLYTFVFSTNEFGVADLLITYISLFVPIITLQLENGVFRFLVDVRGKNDESSEIVTNSFVLILVQIGFSCLIFLVLGFFFQIPFQLYLFGNVIAVVLANVFLQFARGFGNTLFYTIGSVVSGGVNIICNVLFILVFSMGPEAIFISNIIANLLCVLFLFFSLHIFNYIKIKYIQKNRMKSLLKYSVPLIPNSIVWWIINVSDRTIITIFLGVAANGIYAVSNKFANVLGSLFGLFNLSWTESAALSIHEKDRSEYFSSIISTGMTLFFTAGILILIFLPFLFSILIGKEYNEAYNYIPLLILGSLMNGFVGLTGAIYIALKETKKVAQTSFYSGVLNIVINLLFIKYIGLYAAALSTFLSFLIMAIYRYIDVQKFVKIHISSQLIFKICFVFALSLLSYYSANFFFRLILFLIILFFLFYLNKDSFIGLKNYIFKKKKVSNE